MKKLRPYIKPRMEIIQMNANAEFPLLSGSPLITGVMYEIHEGGENDVIPFKTDQTEGWDSGTYDPDAPSAKKSPAKTGFSSKSLWED